MNVGLEDFDERAGIALPENECKIHHAKRRDNGKPVLLALQRPSLSLELPHHGVAVDAHGKDIAEGGSFGKVLDMPGVDDVEAAVGGDEGFALGTERRENIMQFRSRLKGVS